MNTSSLMTHRTHLSATTPFFLHNPLRLLLFNILVWTTFSLIGTLTSLNGALRDGKHGNFWLEFQYWGSSALALAGLSLILNYCITRWKHVLANAMNIAIGYVLMQLALLPFQLLYLSKIFINDHGKNITLYGIKNQLLVFDQIGGLLCFTSTTAVYFAIVSLKIWQQSQERAIAASKAQAKSLSLSLELEQQRLHVLRSQLEPHFVFNALNAISALVRSDNKEIALNSINGLSELLRYALQASEDSNEKKWVNFADELHFVDDYVALQRLRYGARLQIVFDGTNEEILSGDCPPFLIQTLIENAIRHDLDCHNEVSDIRVQFMLQHELLHITVSNPVYDCAPENRGLGLGLRNTTSRLRLMYGSMATLQTDTTQHRFRVNVTLPLQKPNSSISIDN